MTPAAGSASFHVDPDALEAVISLLDAFEKDTEQFIAEVERQVNGLHVDWVGDTAAGHVQAQQKWASGASDMRDAVAQLSSIVSRAHGNYGSAAAANTAMWQR